MRILTVSIRHFLDTLRASMLGNACFFSQLARYGITMRLAFLGETLYTPAA